MDVSSDELKALPSTSEPRSAASVSLVPPVDALGDASMVRHRHGAMARMLHWSKGFFFPWFLWSCCGAVVRFFFSTFAVICGDNHQREQGHISKIGPAFTPISHLLTSIAKVDNQLLIAMISLCVLLRPLVCFCSDGALLPSQILMGIHSWEIRLNTAMTYNDHEKRCRNHMKSRSFSQTAQQNQQPFAHIA